MLTRHWKARESTCCSAEFAAFPEMTKRQLNEARSVWRRSMPQSKNHEPKDCPRVPGIESKHRSSRRQHVRAGTWGGDVAELSSQVFDGAWSGKRCCRSVRIVQGLTRQPVSVSGRMACRSAWAKASAHDVHAARDGWLCNLCICVPLDNRVRWPHAGDGMEVRCVRDDIRGHWGFAAEGQAGHRLQRAEHSPARAEGDWRSAWRPPDRVAWNYEGNSGCPGRHACSCGGSGYRTTNRLSGEGRGEKGVRRWLGLYGSEGHVPGLETPACFRLSGSRWRGNRFVVHHYICYRRTQVHSG